MSRSYTIYKEVEVEVDLDDFETGDLVEELESRAGLHAGGNKELLQSIYEKRRLGQSYQAELDQLIWLELGRIL